MLIKATLIVVAMALWGAAMLAAFAVGIFAEQTGKPYQATESERQRVAIAFIVALTLAALAFATAIAA